jgi:hypothetical protein
MRADGTGEYIPMTDGNSAEPIKTVSILDEIQLITADAQKCADATIDPVLKPISQAFLKNIKDVGGLLALPQVFSSQTPLTVGMISILGNVLPDVIGKPREVIAQLSSLSESLKKGKLSGSSLDDVQVIPGPDPLANAFMSGLAERLPQIVRVTNLIASQFLASPGVYPLVEKLLSLAVSSAWTAFECLATDTWVSVLNSRPRIMANRALAAKATGDGPDGLTGKQLEVGLIARRGFDLRSCMGTLLKPKFDLTSLPNIKDAYWAIFREKSKVPKELEDSFGSADLALLESHRHVIVHRAGIVDDEFRKKTAKLGLDYPEGKTLPLDGAMVSRLTNAAIKSGCELLAFVDKWLVENPG